MTASSKPAAKPASKTSAYSRFIPREEIDAVASWRFSSMDSDLAPLEPSEPGEPSAAESANLQAEREQAWAEGFARGREEGERLAGTFQESLQTLRGMVHKSAMPPALGPDAQPARVEQPRAVPPGPQSQEIAN